MTFVAPSLLAAFERELGLGAVTLRADPDRAIYAALGFGRASFRRVWLDPRVWRRYAALLARGRRARAPEQDPLQLGGDAVLGRDGEVFWRFASRGPEDRPAASIVVEEAAKAAKKVLRRDASGR